MQRKPDTHSSRLPWTFYFTSAPAEHESTASIHYKHYIHPAIMLSQITGLRKTSLLTLPSPWHPHHHHNLHSSSPPFNPSPRNLTNITGYRERPHGLKVITVSRPARGSVPRPTIKRSAYFRRFTTFHNSALQNAFFPELAQFCCTRNLTNAIVILFISTTTITIIIIYQELVRLNV